MADRPSSCLPILHPDLGGLQGENDPARMTVEQRLALVTEMTRRRWERLTGEPTPPPSRRDVIRRFRLGSEPRDWF